MFILSGKILEITGYWLLLVNTNYWLTQTLKSYDYDFSLLEKVWIKCAKDFIWLRPTSQRSGFQW